MTRAIAVKSQRGTRLWNSGFMGGGVLPCGTAMGRIVLSLSFDSKKIKLSVHVEGLSYQPPKCRRPHIQIPRWPNFSDEQGLVRWRVHRFPPIKFRHPRLNAS